MISISENANKNYLAKLIEVTDVKKHPNADKLQLVTVDFQNVVTGLDAKVGDRYVYFPVESAIDLGFLSATNSFRDNTMNSDKEASGFFESKGRVRAVKLRGEYSLGYIVPVASIESFYGKLEANVGDYFDSVNGMIIVKKYIVPGSEPKERTNNGKKPRISRLVDGQVHLHVDTQNLRKEAYRVSPQDTISITYKIHGTSGWVSNVLVKKKLSTRDKIAKFLGVNIEETEYDFVYGSRKVVKNEYETQNTNDFYDVDIWGTIKDELKEVLPKGYTIYYEAVGDLPTGSHIQGKYDYGCSAGQHRVYIYRITFTNVDGVVFNLTYQEIADFCEKRNLTVVPLFYLGSAKDLFAGDTEQHWHEALVEYLQEHYTEKDCYLCKNVVPEEGIVLRKETSKEFEAYKLKSYRFLEAETAELDKGEVNIEDNV